jgi:hypothetical protein
LCALPTQEIGGKCIWNMKQEISNISMIQQSLGGECGHYFFFFFTYLIVGLDLCFCRIKECNVRLIYNTPTLISFTNFNALTRHTVQPFRRYCNKICPPEDGTLILETCRRL